MKRLSKHLDQGPADAPIVVLLARASRADMRLGQLLSGAPGRIFDMCLTPAGLRRIDLRFLAMKDVEGRSTRWQNALHASNQILLPLGQEALDACCNGHGSLGDIAQWRGSLLPPLTHLSDDLVQNYWLRLPFRGFDSVALLPCYDPAMVEKRMEWHYWLVNDLARAQRFVSGGIERRYRTWHTDDLDALTRLVLHTLPSEGIVSIDTEMNPLVTSIVSRDEVHVFTFEWRHQAVLQQLMHDERIVKVAHNMQHDWRQFEKVYRVEVKPPWFDTIGGAHALEPGGSSHDDEDTGVDAGEQQVGKSLSPHIATRFTPWPFHKWLSQTDMYTYCGMDSVVGYDAYVEQQRQIEQRPKLKAILEQDMRLFEPLFRASSDGLIVDEAERRRVTEEMQGQLAAGEAEVEALAAPFVEDALKRKRFRLPHLFEARKQCRCCGGGKAKVMACWGCQQLDAAPSKVWLLSEAFAIADAEGWERDAREALKKQKKAELVELVLGMCNECGGHGHTVERLPLNLGSTKQVADLLYRGMRIPARRFQGSETTRFDQLQRLLSEDGYLSLDKGRDAERSFVQQYIELARLRSEVATLERLSPGEDGRLRTTFDLWYTPTHRVASREGLLDVGTNLQNLPKLARRFIVPLPGHAFLYPDYAQIEGRCQAVLSGDQKLLDIYHSGRDSHMEVVRMLSEEGITITRDQAKRVSYAAFYDIGAPHLADILQISIPEAERALTGFFRVFQGAARYKRRVAEELRTSRSCTSPTGWRRRWLGYVMETSGRRKGEVRKKLVKQALASGPQNMAAHVMAEGLIAVWDETRDWIRPKAHVHDSCLLEVGTERLAEAIPLVERLMSVEAFGMPFPVESVCGPNWLAASTDDKKKKAAGLDGWQRASILQHGIPRAQ